MKIVRNLVIALLLLATAPFAAAMEPIDINTADAAALAAAISGVGMKKAEAVIAYREKNGPFQRVEDLANVKGIGAKIVEKNRDLLTVGTAPVAADH
ncbi:ComEA family DNA-binding protein [Endothiovibrio diazotrophicus]